MPNNNTESLQQTSALDLVGRTELVSNLINKLRDNYFVSVSGPVGSGKSTLVKNLLTQELFNNTALEGRAGNDWRVVYTCPGVNPIGNLAADIRKASGNLAGDDSGKERGIFQEGTLSPEDQDLALEKFRTNGSILTQLYKKALTKIQHPFNLLLIVDQAHDLFRYQRFWSSNAENKSSLEPILGDDVAFINLLLNAKRSIAPIYIILVSDTNYAGNFAPYRGLPETMNNSSFYVPHLMDAELDYFLDTLIPNKKKELEEVELKKAELKKAKMELKEAELKKVELELRKVELKELELKEAELKGKLKKEFIDISRTKDVSPLLEMNLFFHLLEQKKQQNPEYSPVQLAGEIVPNPNPENRTYLQGVITYYVEEYLGQKKLSKSVQYLLQALTGVVGANQLVRNPVTMETLEKLQDRKALLKKVSPPTNSLSIDKMILGLMPGKKAPKPQEDSLVEVNEKPLNIRQIFDELSKFNVKGRKLILLPEPHELSKTSIVDFNYDVLLSSWPKLKNLIKEEWEYAQVFRNFVRDAIFHYTNSAQTDTNPGKGFPVAAFTSLKKWIDYCKPNEAWAERYLPTPPSNEDLEQLKQHPAFEGQPNQKLTNWFIANQYYAEIEAYFDNLEQQKERQKERTENQRTLAVILGSISAILCIIALVFFKEAKQEKQIIEAREFLHVLSYNAVLNIPNDIDKNFDAISNIQKDVDEEKIKSLQGLLGTLNSEDKISIGSEREEVKELSFEALITLKEFYKVDDKEAKGKLLEKFEALYNLERNHNKAFHQTHYPAFYHALNAYYWEKKKYDTIPGTLIDPGALDVHPDGKRYSFGDKNGQAHLIVTNTEYKKDRKPTSHHDVFINTIKPIKSIGFGRHDTLYLGTELGAIYRLHPVSIENKERKNPVPIFSDDKLKTIHFLKSWPENSNYLLVSSTLQVYFLNKKADGKFGHLTNDRSDVFDLPPESRIACRTWDSESKLFLIGYRDSVLIYHLNPLAQKPEKPIKKICSIKNDQTKSSVTFTSVAIKKKEDDDPNSFQLALGDETGNVWIGDLLISNLGKKSTEYDLKEFRKFENVHASTITCMAFNPGSPQLASASYDGSLKFWNLNTLHKKKNFDDVFLRYNSGIQAIAYLNKDELVVYYDLYHFVEPTNANFMYEFLKNNQD